MRQAALATRLPKPSPAPALPCAASPFVKSPAAERQRSCSSGSEFPRRISWRKCARWQERLDRQDRLDRTVPAVPAHPADPAHPPQLQAEVFEQPAAASRLTILHAVLHFRLSLLHLRPLIGRQD